MIDLPKKATKKFIKIGAAAEKMGVSIDTLRRWEKAGKLEVIRTPGGTRLYAVSTLKELTSTPLKYRKSSAVSRQLSDSSTYQTSTIDHKPLTINNHPSPAATVEDLITHLDKNQNQPIAQEATPQTDQKWQEFMDARNSEPEVVTVFSESELPSSLVIPGDSPSLRGASITSDAAIFPGRSSRRPNVSGLLRMTKIIAFSGLLATLLIASLALAKISNFQLPNLAAMFNLQSTAHSLQPTTYNLQPVTSSVLAAETANSYLDINTDVNIVGDLAVSKAVNGLTLASTADGFSVSGGTSSRKLTVSGGDVTLDQDVSTSSSPTFAGLTLPATSKQITLGGGILTWTPTGAKIITLPDATGTVLLDSSTQTITNKTISGASNTFSNIPGSALTDAKITITAGTNLSGGGDIALGGSGTLSLKDAVSLASLVATGAISSATLTTSSYHTLSQTTAPAVTTDKLYNVSGVLLWNGVDLTSGGALPTGTSGQTLYHNGTAWTANSNLFNDGTNVGIGTANPGFKLDVNGIVNATALYVNGSAYIGSQWTTAVLNIYYTTGNVGIGTTNPLQKLDVVGGSIRTDNQFISTLVTGTSPFSVSSTTVNTNLNADLLDGNHAAAFQTALTNPVTGIGTSNYIPVFSSTSALANSTIWNSGGNVGIGTTAPRGTLDVEGAGSIVLNAGNVGIGNFNPAGTITVSPTNMTGNGTPPPYVASASSYYDGSSDAFSAFDGTDATRWMTYASTGWLAIDLGSITTVTQYQITGDIEGCCANRSPKTWTFEGSNTGAFSGEQTILDTQTNAPAWSVPETRTYILSASQSYRYYRLNISANESDSTFIEVGSLILGNNSGQIGSKLVVQGIDSSSANSALNVTNGGGTSLLFVQNSGNVGIGTTSPTQLFSVGSTSQFNVTSAGAVTAAGINAGGAISGVTTLAMNNQLTSTLAIGTAPFAVTSTTLNTNLNADLLDGQHAAAFQTALTNPVTGTGTSNYIPVFSSTSSLANSTIWNSGGNVGIGTTNPGNLLEIAKDSDTYLSVHAITGTGQIAGLILQRGSLVDGLYNDWTIKNSSGNFYLNSDGAAGDAMFINGDTGLTNIAANATIGYALGTTSSANGLAVSGNVGIGTTSPAGALHVAGQCVTGDTLLKRRRRRRKSSALSRQSSDSDEDGLIADSEAILTADDYYWEDVRIDEIKAGDEILTLDEKSGEFITSKIKALQKMGIQDVFQLVTASGKKIRTTGNHPYLAKKPAILGPSGTFEADQSNRMEDLTKDSFIALANIATGESFIASITSGEKRKAFKHYQKESRFFGPILWARMIAYLIQKYSIHNSKVILDTEYPSYEKVIDQIIYQSGEMIFTEYQSIGRNSYAHEAVYEKATGKKLAHKKATGALTQYVQVAEDMLHPEFTGIRTPSDRSHNLYHKLDSLSIKQADWIKVYNLELGWDIATVDGWEKIISLKKVAREQVFDIEVEGTHNFVGNNIVAHNTILMGNVGIGTTAPAQALHVVGTAEFQQTAGSQKGCIQFNNTNGDLEYSNDCTNYQSLGATAGGWSDQGTYTRLTTTSANVGIGITTLPISKLQVQGDSGLLFNVSTSASNLFTVASSGNVGIGTTGPATKLDISGGDMQILGNGKLYFPRSDGSQTAYIYNSLVGVTGSQLEIHGDGSSSGTIQLIPGTSGSVAITQGNVGIGTTAPGQKLEVAGNIWVNYANPDLYGLKVTATTATNAAGAYFTNGTDGLFVGQDNSTGSRITGIAYASYLMTNSAKSLALGTNQQVNMTILSGGNMGIGTTNPTTPLYIQPAAIAGGSIGTGMLTLAGAHNTVNRPIINLRNTTAGTTYTGGIRWYNGDGTEGWGIENNRVIGTGYLEFNIAGANKMLIDPAGNVGMGITAPAYKLEVSGSINASTSLCIAGVCQTTWPGGGTGITGSGTTGYMPKWSTATTLGNSLIYDSGTAIGIGTASPGLKLDIQTTGATSAQAGLSATGTGNARFYFDASNGDYGDGDYGSVGQDNDLSVNLENYGNAPIYLRTNNSTVLTASGAGNVGIGTVTPSNALTVRSDTQPIMVGGAVGGSYNRNFGGLNWDVVNSRDVAVLTGASDAAIYANGASRLFVRGDSGNVGIGITVPVSILDVQAANAILRLTSTTGTNSVYQRIANTGGNAYIGIENSAGNDLGATGALPYALTLNAPGGKAIQFGTGNPMTTRMTIDSAGNVGIGTTSPGTLFTVQGTGFFTADFRNSHVSGAEIILTPTATGGGAFQLASTANSNGFGGGKFVITEDGTTPYLSIIRSSGNVGIGTASPTDILDVRTGANVTGLTISSPNNSGAGSQPALIFKRYNGSGTLSTVAGIYSGACNDNAPTCGDLTLMTSTDTSQNSRMTINAAGSIYTGGATGGAQGAGTINSTGLFVNGVAVSTAAGNYWTTATGGIQYGSNVGIGTGTPAQKLEVAGNIKISNTNPYLEFYSTGWSASSYIQTNVNPLGQGSGDQNNLIFLNPASKGYAFTIGSTPQFVISGAGNVGIGITSPTSTLDVQGATAIQRLTSTTGTNTTYQAFVNTGGTAVIGIEPSAGNSINAGGAGYALGIYPPSGKLLQLGYSGGTGVALTIGTTGNVGIGTTAPAYKLDVNGTLNTTGLYINGSAFASSQWTTADSNIGYTTGNVGIGTTAPAQALNLVGTMQIQQTSGATTQGCIKYNAATLQLQWSNDCTAYQSFSAPSAGGWTYDSINNIVKLTTSSSNVGIGVTNPGAKLDVAGNIKITGEDAVLKTDGEYLRRDASGNINFDAQGGYIFNIDANNNDTSTVFGVRSNAGTTNLVTIQQDGNVGIGTVSPEQKLTLNGDAHIYNTGTLGANLVDTWTNGATNPYETFTLGTPTSDIASAINTSGFGIFNKAITITAGRRYKATFTLTLNSGTAPYFSSNTGLNLQGAVATTLTTAGANSIEWTSTRSGTEYITFYNGNGVASNFAITGFSLQEVTGGNLNLAGLLTGGGTTGLKVDGAGNVGIGTTAPQTQLQVNTPSSNSLQWAEILNNPNNSANANTGVGLKFRTAYIEDGSLESSKWVGIASAANVGTTYNDYMGLAFYTHNTGPATETMRITAAGNVGIGTASPGALLDISRSDGSSSTLVSRFGLAQAVNANAFIEIVASNGSTRKASQIVTYTSGATGFANNATPGTWGTEFMRVDENGNIGINTTTTGSYKVNVAGTLNSTGLFVNGVAVSTAAGNYWTTATGGIQYGSNVGIGTATPDNPLTISGALAGNGLHLSSTTGAGIILDKGGDGNWAQVTYKLAGVNQWNVGTLGNGNYSAYNSVNATYPFTITAGAPTASLFVNSSGNVGIGTTAPAATLSVAGIAGVAGSGTINFTSSNIALNGGGTEAVISGNSSSANTTGRTFTILNVTGATADGGYGSTTHYGILVNPTFTGNYGGSTGYGVYIDPTFTNGQDPGFGTKYALYTTRGTVTFACTGQASWANAGTNPTCSDYAEVYETNDNNLEAGDLISVDVNNSNKVTKSATVYQNQIIGVYSTSPGMLIGPDGIINPNGEKVNLSAGKVPVALTGRVPTKVSTENGPITTGDYLTSSSIPGVAMKATRPGQVVGKALENYPSTESANGEVQFGKIMVFVNVSYADPGNFLANFSFDADGNLIMPKVKIDKLVLSSGVTLDIAAALESTDARLKNIEDAIMGVSSSLRDHEVAWQSSTSVADSSSMTSVGTQNDILGLQAVVATQSAQISSTSTTLSTAIASQSAEISSLKAQIASLSAQVTGYNGQQESTSSASASNCTLYPETCNLNLTPPSILLATSSAQLVDLSVTSEATFSGKLTAYDLSVQNIFKSLGDSFLGNTTVAGDFSVDGTLSVTGNSINSVGAGRDLPLDSGDPRVAPTDGILYLQNNPLAGNVDFFNGQVTIDKTGKLVAQEISAKTITTNKLIIDNNVGVGSSNPTGQENPAPTLGSNTIPAGTLEIPVITSAVTDKSKIFLTPTTPTGGQAVILGEIVAGTGFVVKLDHTYISDIKFNWLIIDSK